MKSNLASKTESAAMITEIKDQWDIDIPKTKNLRIYELDGANLITGEQLKALHIKNRYVPFLSDYMMLAKFPAVTIDMGAVKFVCNGANIMRPGIKSMDAFVAGQLVCIVEESQKKFLAVGEANVSSIEAQSMPRGEIVKCLHYISDKFWESAKSL